MGRFVPSHLFLGPVFQALKIFRDQGHLKGEIAAMHRLARVDQAAVAAMGHAQCHVAHPLGRVKIPLNGDDWGMVYDYLTISYHILPTQKQTIQTSSKFGMVGKTHVGWQHALSPSLDLNCYFIL